jgi:hypothetical protein
MGPLDETIALWNESSEDFPELGRRFGVNEQEAREAKLDRFLGAVRAELRAIPATRAERGRARERITTAFVEFAGAALDLEDRHIELLLKGGFSGIGTDLGRQARRFDPEVPAADILQACRNAWAACGLQSLLGCPMRVTPAIFAYSMLYPYTDNYLDDAAVSRDAKLGFSKRFQKRLSGQPVDAANRHEEQIWGLVGMIEGQYPRCDFPQVYDALLAIHRAQEESLSLMRAAEPVDFVRLGFQKGGTSVLADAYLAAGSLDTPEVQFAFEWGVHLQLADDLQDVREDRADGVLTVFSEAAGRVALDALTNRTFALARTVMGRVKDLASGHNTLRELIERSAQSLVIRAAGDVPEFYTPDYLRRLEGYSPFRFGFLKQRREQLSRWSGAYAQLFESFLAGDEDEAAFPLLPSALMPKMR